LAAVRKPTIEQQETIDGHDNKTKIPIYWWMISWLIASFYLLSSVGWFWASFVAIYGNQNPNVSEFIGELSIFDHLIRYLQVIIIAAGSCVLLFMRKLSYTLFSISFLCSLIAMLLIGKWTISFMSPFILGPSFLYLLYLDRMKLLK
jgi:hypothetical protein